MSVLPFSISSEAATRIAELLEMGGEGVNLVPVLCFAYSMHSFDEGGKEKMRYPEHFIIGWYYSELLQGNEIQIEILGIKLLAWPEVLKRLEGKQLVLETVEIGFPNPADEKTKLLRAVPIARREGGGVDSL